MTKIRHLSWIALSWILLLSGLSGSLTRLVADERVYVSAKDAKQIIVYALDSETGQLSQQQTVALPGEPGALVASRDRRYLFAALRSTGELASLKIDPTSGDLKLINVVSAGADPAQISTDRSGRFLLTAYYVAAKVSVHTIDENGMLSDQPWQEVPTLERAHAIMLDSQQRFAFVPHTGPDTIFQFLWDARLGRLTPNDPARLRTPDNSGPRHLAWHPAKAVAYIDNEQASSVTAYVLDGTTGRLQPSSTATTLPSENQENNSTAEIKVHPSGQWLYVSNRGHDSLARVSIDETGENLTWKDTTPTEQTPRSFDLTSDGRWLVAAGEGSGALRVYRIDPKNGQLTSTWRREVSPGLWWVACLSLPN